MDVVDRHSQGEELRGELEGDGVLEVDGALLAERVKALQGDGDVLMPELLLQVVLHELLGHVPVVLGHQRHDVRERRDQLCVQRR